MSKFADDKTKREKQEERRWEQKKIHEKYFSDISKLSFTALVLAQAAAIYEGSVSPVIMIIGTMLTIVFKIIGNNFLK